MIIESGLKQLYGTSSNPSASLQPDYIKRLCWTDLDIEEARTTLETQVLGNSEINHRRFWKYSPMEMLIPLLLMSLGTAMLILSILSNYDSGHDRDTEIHTKNMDTDVIDFILNSTTNASQALPP